MGNTKAMVHLDNWRVRPAIERQVADHTHNSFPVRHPPRMRLLPEYILPKTPETSSTIPTLCLRKRAAAVRHSRVDHAVDNDHTVSSTWQTTNLAAAHMLEPPPQNPADYVAWRHPNLDYLKAAPKQRRREMYAQANKSGAANAANYFARCVRSKVDQHRRGGMALLRRAFHTYDPAGSGQVDMPGLAQAMELFKLQFDEKELLAVFAQFDHFFTGMVAYEELCSAVLADSAESHRGVVAAGDSLMPWETAAQPVQQKVPPGGIGPGCPVRQRQQLNAKHLFGRSGAKPHIQGASRMLPDSAVQRPDKRTLTFDKASRVYSLRAGGPSGLLSTI